MKKGGAVGRLPVSRIRLPTTYAKRQGKVSTAFLLVIDRYILKYIWTCTELEASGILYIKCILTQKKKNENLL